MIPESDVLLVVFTHQFLSEYNEEYVQLRDHLRNSPELLGLLRNLKTMLAKTAYDEAKVWDAFVQNQKYLKKACRLFDRKFNPYSKRRTIQDQMDNDPQLKARNFYQEQDHPEVGKYRPPRQPCVLSKTPCEIRRAPLIGEHSEYAFKEILGMTDDEIEELVVEGVIE